MEKKKILFRQSKKSKIEQLKEYEYPHLTRYGNLKQITTAVSGAGDDGGLGTDIPELKK